MVPRSAVTFGLVMLLLPGCAIHPVPEDVTGVDTYHIVRQIRCETRESLKAIILERLDALARHGDQTAQKLLADYDADAESVANFRPDAFKGPEYNKVRQFFYLVLQTGIAYNFDLTMSEDNDVTADLSLLNPFALAKFSLGLNAGAKRKRSNERTFTVTDSFEFLLGKLNTPVRGQRYCDRQIVGENYAYPVAGRIGVGRTVKTFLELTVFGNLAGKEGAPGIPAAPPIMADKLTFTTTVNFSAAPKIEFTPVGRNFQVANAGFTSSAVRMDKHEVTVGLALPAALKADLDPFRSYIFSRDRSVGSESGVSVRLRGAVVPDLYIGARVTGGGSPAERLAVIAIDQLKSRELQLIGLQ